MCVNPPYPNINKKVIIYNKNVLTLKNIVYNEGSKLLQNCSKTRRDGNMEEIKTFREWRKEKGYTTKYIASKIGITPYTLNRKEYGKADFTKVQEMLLCNIYEIKMSQVKTL